MGWTQINVAFWDVDQATADAAMLADNRLGELSSPDGDRVAELLREIPEVDWLSVGYSAEEAAKLTAELEAAEIAVREIATSTVADRFWISVHGPLVDQARVLQALKRVMAEFGLVTVEMGTTDQ